MFFFHYHTTFSCTVQYKKQTTIISVVRHLLVLSNIAALLILLHYEVQLNLVNYNYLFFIAIDSKLTCILKIFVHVSGHI